MLTIAYYFLQVVLCSGMMMGYYWLVLRNKRFHQYNRFYLLAIALLSWVVPLIKISWSKPVVISEAPQVMQFLSVVADNNSLIEATITKKGFEWSWDMLATGIYVTVAAILLFGMIRALIRLYYLLKQNSCKSVGDVYLILTQAKGTPFSFFRYIFWNEEIDIRSEAGKQILQHELTHVQQKHSFDKLFIQVMLIGGWFNPFFWLLRREMEMIHEFIADKKAVNNGDTASLAQMLLTAAYPQQQFALTHPFFFSPIKRRLQMLTNNTNPRFSYIRRLVVLPLLAVVVVLFAFRSKEQRDGGTLSVATVVENVVDVFTPKIAREGNTTIPVFNNAMLNRSYTVVIDAGHGGTDIGVTGLDGTHESELTLSMAKAIKELNTNENLHIVLIRDADVFHHVTKSAAIANENNPDLFVSLHCNEVADVKNKTGYPTSGIEIFIPSKDAAVDYNGSVAFANVLANSMKGLNAKMPVVKSRSKGIYLLKTVQSPAVLVQAGYMTDKNDLQKLKDVSYQKQIAGSILKGINDYLRGSSINKQLQTLLLSDTIPAKQPVSVVSYGSAVHNDAVRLSQPSPPMNALIVVDGKKTDLSSLSSLDPNQIQSVSVFKDAKAIDMYGEEGRNGVIVITTKNFAVENVSQARENLRSIPMSSVAKDIMGNPAKNRKVFIKNTIYQGSASGTKVWEETNEAKSNEEGIFTVNLGLGVRSSSILISDLSKIDWSKGPFFINLKVAVAPSIPAAWWIPQDNYVDQGTTQLFSVAYAVYQGNAKVTNVNTSIQPGQKNTFLITDSLGNVNWSTPDTEKPGNKMPEPVTTVANLIQDGDRPAEFSGGSGKFDWLMTSSINKIGIPRTGEPTKYKLNLSFLIDKEGNLSNITMEGNLAPNMKEALLNVLSAGPKWKPALQKGKAIPSQYKRSLIFLDIEGKGSIHPHIFDGEKRTYYYYCLSNPARGEVVSVKETILYTDVQNTFCDEADVMMKTQEWGQLVDKLYPSPNGKSRSSDLNQCKNDFDGEKQIESLLSRYKNSSLYDIRKLPFNSGMIAKLDPNKNISEPK